ncbi:MAG: ABC transporter permease [Caldisericaceae bacterium]
MTEELTQQKEVSTRVEGYWYLVVKRLKKHKLAVFSLFVLIAIILLCIVGPYFTRYSMNEMGNATTDVLQAPSLRHWFGTDELGRDVFTRVLLGGRVSLLVGFASVFSALLVGIIVGAYAGYYGGILDTVLMRFTDIMFSIPVLPLLVVLSSVIPGAGVWKIIMVIALFGWMTDARIIRGLFLSLRESEYNEAARAIGVSSTRIIWRHLLPNALAPIIVSATLGVGGNIIYEAALSYLGFGVMPPDPSWGNILQNAQYAMAIAPWLVWAPGLAILITVIAFNFLGDGLRDAMDPKLYR